MLSQRPSEEPVNPTYAWVFVSNLWAVGGELKRDNVMQMVIKLCVRGWHVAIVKKVWWQDFMSDKSDFN